MKKTIIESRKKESLEALQKSSTKIENIFVKESGNLVDSFGNPLYTLALMTKDNTLFLQTRSGFFQKFDGEQANHPHDTNI